MRWAGAPVAADMPGEEFAQRAALIGGIGCGLGSLGTSGVGLTGEPPLKSLCSFITITSSSILRVFTLTTTNTITLLPRYMKYRLCLKFTKPELCLFYHIPL